mmetsp:Transcript_132978/g.384531  ORF Transcript_132978/g.384531 Transcript_132978/m.384531 type:complete len:647 (-) Transcript_132978:236-2176(-)
MGRGRRTLRSCRVRWYKEAPLEWLVRMNRSRGLATLTFWGILSCMAGLLDAPVDLSCWGAAGATLDDFDDEMWLASHVAVGVAALVFAVALSLRKVPPHMFETIVVVLHVLQVMSCCWSLRSHTQAVLFCGFGWPMLANSFAFAGVRGKRFFMCMVLDAGQIWLAAWRKGYADPPCAFMFSGIAMAVFVQCAQHTQWRDIYDAQQDDAAEKEASEALLSMICDAACWIAADGETVLRGDSRLDSIMGISMQGKKLSAYLPEPERKRLYDTMGRGCCAALRVPVTLLPVTLLRPQAAAVDVDLFIVDRRLAFAAARVSADLDARGAVASNKKDRLGFLIGFRLAVPWQAFSAPISPLASEAAQQQYLVPCPPLPVEMLNEASEDACTSDGGSDSVCSELFMNTRADIDMHRPQSVVSGPKPASVTSIPATLASAQLPAPQVHACTRQDVEVALRGESGIINFPKVPCLRKRETIGAALALICDHASGGALICVGDARSFQQVFVAADELANRRVPAIRVCDGGYMTQRLKGVHITDPIFAEAFREFTERSDTDCWPEGYADVPARGLPKDGAFLIASSGYRLKCAAKLLGMVPPGCWEKKGTKHEAALACAAAVAGCCVLVRSDAGTVHIVMRDKDQLHVYSLDSDV